MRLFIGISVPAELHDYCDKLQRQFSGIKKTEEYHLTLQFLGDGIGELFLPRITEALKSIKFKPFEIRLGRARRFPNEHRPNGVWIDCDGGEALRDLAERIRKAMDKIGFKPDKPFLAHITLGRYKEPLAPKGGTRPQMVRESAYENHSFRVDRFFLMESHLAQEGATYKTLAELPA